MSSYINIGPAIVTFEQESLTVSEGSGNVTVCVEMTGIPAGGLGHDVSVSFNAMSGPRAGTIIILVTQEPYSHRFVCGVAIIKMMHCLL